MHCKLHGTPWRCTGLLKLLHRGDFRPRDYASSPAGATAGSASRRARGRTVRPGRVPHLPRRGSRRSHGTPLPAPPSGSSPETPLDERGCESSTIDAPRSQAQNVVITGYATPPTSLLAVRSRRPRLRFSFELDRSLKGAAQSKIVDACDVLLEDGCSTRIIARDDRLADFIACAAKEARRRWPPPVSERVDLVGHGQGSRLVPGIAGDGETQEQQ